jgi:hypothetical protein
MGRSFVASCYRTRSIGVGEGMRGEDVLDLSDCRPHGELLKRTPPIRFSGRQFVAQSKRPAVENYEFLACNFDGICLDGASFSDCTFQDCSFRRTDQVSTHFWSSRFVNCTFKDAQWLHSAFREATFEDCSFVKIDLEVAVLAGCRFSNVTWDHGSLLYVYFDWCTLNSMSFTEAVVDSVFRDCKICDGAFDHIVEGESRITICSTGTEATHTGEPATANAAEPVRSSIFVGASTIISGKGQDPLERFRVHTGPTRKQLDELDQLLATATDEAPFQAFLEQNPEVLTVAVALGHHGLYVLPQVPFGRKHRADFMVGAKNSMGHFWTGLEIESPRHKVLKADGHFTQKVQHAIDQVVEWRTYVRTHRATVQRPKVQYGEGLVGIEPDFQAWIVIGRDPSNRTADERRSRFLDSARNIHVQTWDGFRDRVAAAVRTRRET